MNRGARQLPIFGDDSDRDAFIAYLASTNADQETEIHAYALMGNHFHLLVRSPVPPLGAMMKTIAGGYTQRFNKKYGLDGSLFRGRYRSKPIGDERYLLQIVQYIHRNPVADLRRAERLSDYRWTSHPAYFNRCAVPAWLHTSTILGLLGGDLDRYRELIEKKSLGNQRPEPTERMIVRTLQPSDIDGALLLASPMERDLVSLGGRGIRTPVRSAAVLLCRELTDATADQLSQRYGFAGASSVRSAVSRAREAAASDAVFARLIADARARLASSFRRDSAATDGTGV
ncbi:MAG: putative transposase [Candidatus Aldehydirespiratoraceae bacterium]|jgi:putative transposase